MTHLTDEQFEHVLQGLTPPPPHLDECDSCRARLAEAEAVRGRLRSAMETVTADQALEDRIRAMLPSGGTYRAQRRPAARTLRLPLRRLLWPAIAVAAALVIAIPLMVFFGAPESAVATEESLYRIHEHSLSPHADFYAGSTPEELAVYLKDQLGFQPAVPNLKAGMRLRGCCVSHFRQKPVGTYVVDTDQGVISIIVLTDRADAAGLRGQMQVGDRTYETGSFARCQMVAVELNGYTYCAIGETSYEFLIDLLGRLVPAAD
ncbi:MAG: anti-sigma factor family protein [Planctomycetota bacterium]|jgi:hypothetical protein